MPIFKRLFTKLTKSKKIIIEYRKFKPGYSNNRHDGFTLPELLIVMTILAGLAAVMIVSFPASQRRARDTRRRSDLKQYQTALELYNNKNNVYPSSPASGTLASQCSALGITGTCPDDPTSSAHYRFYWNATDYVLYATLQQPPSPTTYFEVCSNGKAGDTTTVPTSVNCTLP